MNINYKVTTAIAAAVIADLVHTHRLNKKRFANLTQDRNNNAELVGYYAHLLNTNGIVPSDFDQIIMHNLATK